MTKAAKMKSKKTTKAQMSELLKEFPFPSEPKEPKPKKMNLTDIIVLLAKTYSELHDDIQFLKKQKSLANAVGESVLFEFLKIIAFEREKDLISEEQKYKMVLKALQEACRSYANLPKGDDSFDTFLSALLEQ